MRRLVALGVGTALLILQALPAHARYAASQFTVIAQVGPFSTTNGGYATLYAHTRIGSTCIASVLYDDGSTVPGLATLPRHAGQDGLVQWRWRVRTRATGGTAAALCAFKGQQQAGLARFAVRSQATAVSSGRQQALGTLLASSVWAMDTTTAGTTQGVGCSAQGYTMQAPSTWMSRHRCSAKTGIAHGRITLTVAVERHGWWSDLRSRLSIAADITNGRTGRSLLQPIAFSTRIIAGQGFVTGQGTYRRPDGSYWTQLEMETFVTGHMYKFIAVDRLSDSTTARGDGRIIGQVWRTIRIGAQHR